MKGSEHIPGRAILQTKSYSELQMAQQAKPEPEEAPVNPGPGAAHGLP